MILLILLVEYIGLGAMAYVGYQLHSLIPQYLINFTATEINSTVTGPLSIFGHNFAIMTAMSLPFIGPVATAGSMAVTGFFLGAFTAYMAGGVGQGPLVLAIAYAATVFLPHGILELSSYAIATAASLELTRGILAKRSKEAALRWLILYAIAVAVLLAAAYVEWWEITTFGRLIHSLL
nr:MAG: hypothetical protein TU35_03770 [Thermoproteus sp. AZ2]